MSTAALFLVITVLLLLVRLLHLASQAMPPLLHFTDSPYVRSVLALCPMLREEYIPTSLWGKSGHLQTIIYGKMGRINIPYSCGERQCVRMHDGATMTFDIFQPHHPHPSGGDNTLCVCPGIANSSESLYIRTFVHHAQTEGYRIAVLNHLGALKDVQLTSARIFNYGCTDEYGTMIDWIQEFYPDTRCIAVGFSMGGNIITKYLGDSDENQAKIFCGISVGQGYDALRAMDCLMSWENFRRCYLFAMCIHMKSLLKHHMSMLFGTKQPKYDMKRIMSATSLVHIDEHYSSKKHGFDSVREYYKSVSCVHCINNVKIPMFFLNALDDPLVPVELLEIPKQFAATRSNVIAAQTRHGGHLGYFEGGVIIPDTITWLDKVVVQYANAAIQVASEKHGSKIQEFAM